MDLVVEKEEGFRRVVGCSVVHLDRIAYERGEGEGEEGRRGERESCIDILCLDA
jgi:hypothetical protein